MIGKQRVRGMVAAATAALSALIIGVSALTASASDYPPSPSVGPTVLGEVVHHGNVSGGTAFTGADVTLGLVAVGALLAVGFVALYLARRRSAATGS